MVTELSLRVDKSDIYPSSGHILVGYLGLYSNKSCQVISDCPEVAHAIRRIARQPATRRKLRPSKAQGLILITSLFSQ